MLRRHFNATTIIAIVALVFAMTGGAFAVTSKGGGSPAAVAAKKKKKPAAKVKLIPGPKGATGPAGPAGPQGPAGPEGKAGKDGTNGKNGEKGEQGIQGNAGTNGKGVKTTELEAGANNTTGHCEAAGGEKIEVEGSGMPSYICNGAEGQEGSFKGTIAPKTVLKGTWSVQYNAAAAGESLMVSLSTGVPVKALSSSQGLIWSEKPMPGEEKALWEAIKNEACLGTAAAPTPPAAPYNSSFSICVYVANVNEANFGSPPIMEPVIELGSASPALAGSGGGEVIPDLLTSRAAGPVVAYGTWATEAQ